VTGTLLRGRIATGDALEIAPGRGTTRVRSIQVHGGAREVAEAGERTALQLSGVELGELPRGIQLTAPGSTVDTTSIAARVELLPEAPDAIRGWTPIRLHLFAAEVLGRVRPLAGALAPGSAGLVEIRTRAAVSALRGDRFILRRPSPATTLGGGEIVDPLWLRRRGSELREALEAFAGGLPETVRLWTEEGGEGGIDAARLASRLGIERREAAEHLGSLVAEQRLLEVRSEPTRWVTTAVYRRIAARAERELERWFRRNRLAEGIPKAEAVSRILSPRGAALADSYLEWLEAQGILVTTGGKVNLPGRTAELSGEESTLARSILDRYAAAGLRPPAPEEVRRDLRAKPQIVDGVIDYLLERSRLVRIPGGLIVSAEAIHRLRSDLLETGWERFSVPQFKERFGLSRKWAIPYLEHLDSSGATRRIGNERLIVRDGR
jgi:selenocysteine-specific elongation factor